MIYDVVIFGGGTAGVSAAYTSAKLGLNTLLVEAGDVLGGAITQGLVVPVMKLDSLGINTDFYTDLVVKAQSYNAQNTYKDGNTGWFNPELLKIVFDNMLKSVNCNVLFSTTPISANKNTILEKYHVQLKHKILSLDIETKYIVDTTANGEIFRILNYEFQKNENQSQAASLRFNISGIDMNAFASWLEEIDSDTNVTTVDRSKSQIHLSTACTWDKSRNWALLPIFEKAVQDEVLNESDCAYFQVFTIPDMIGTLAVNAPRIILKENESILEPFTYSNALTQGRERIYRLHKFCKKYLNGFENSFISHISDTLGVRESYRIKGKYTYTKNDIINHKKFENVAFACDYPIDIHSSQKTNDKLEKISEPYFIPIECLIAECDDNLYAAGRIISADFESQAALRTQMSCFSMGEAVAKDIFKKIK